MRHNFRSHISGDTFLGVNFRLARKDGAPIGIGGASILLRTNRNTSLSSVNNEIIITDAAQGRFQIKEQIISWPAGLYLYSIRITFANGKTRTYVRGRWPIE